MNEQALMNTASAMVKSGKGILAADESTPTIGKRFSQIAVESTFESRNSGTGIEPLLTSGTDQRYFRWQDLHGYSAPYQERNGFIQ